MNQNSIENQNTSEKLLKEHDYEIQLLETIKRFLSSKIKIDKDYAVNLNILLNQHNKSEQISTKCQLFQTWTLIVDGLRSFQNLLNQNVEKIESNILQNLTKFCIQKKNLRKNYSTSLNYLNQQFSNLCDQVQKKRIEYQKCLDEYKLMRSRFENSFIKCGKSGRKVYDFRDKYQKACRKLHLTHNEYVLLLNEASVFETDYKKVFLPSLLEIQLSIQSNLFLKWQQLLKDIVLLLNFSDENSLILSKNIINYIDKINYNDLYNINQTLKLNTNNNDFFNFDESLIDDTSGKLLPNKLAVDNLTIDSLKQKLNRFEISLKEIQDKITFLIHKKSPLLNEKSMDENDDLSIKYVKITSFKEITELKLQEKKFLTQIDLIKNCFNELGCEEIPPGYDMSIEENTDVNDLNKSQVITTSTSIEILDQHKNNSINILAIDRPLVEEEWFHGVLPREDVVRLLRNDGDFLVRETIRNDECQIVLSVCWEGHKHFIVQTTIEGYYRFEGPSFSTVQELIFHQFSSKASVTSRSGAILRNPICREQWELNNSDVILIEKIGKGNFGDVYKAKLQTSSMITNQDQFVAVKTCRVTLPDEHKKRFLQEGRILKQYNHPNIVKLIGICVQKQPIMIVMELVSGGSLLMFLRNKSLTLTEKQLVAMCRDTAAGMCYLESKNCIHRDLAARNCLIGGENIVKISDFGMSREEEEYIVSDGFKQIPIKWTAPEALNFGKYTSLCDVWSYGILMWEIFSRGETPYNGMTNSKAREKINNGYRLSAPDKTCEVIANLMLRCWEYEPESRPHFNEIFAIIDTLYSSYSN